MNVQNIYDLAIRLGTQNDFRSKSLIRKRLKKMEDRYKALPEKEKRLYDTERFKDPYQDTFIHHLEKGAQNVKNVMVGIDIESAEIIVAHELSKRDPKHPIDLVIAHHPEGKALIGLDQVMDLQVDMLAQYGVPVNIAENLLTKRISEVSRGLSPINHFQAVDTARLLGVNFMNVHTPADNMVARFLEKTILAKKPEYVGEILDILHDIPEYQVAARQGAGPMLFSGSREKRTGRIAFTEITGGTEGSTEIYERLAQVGIGTVIAMHQSEKHREAAEKAHINVVIAGHISSDSVGMNLFLDEIEKRSVEIVPCSGFIRVKRYDHHTKK